MIGMVLAAGAGRRLAPYTDTLPKTLVPVDGDRTILDIALGNLKAAGVHRLAGGTREAANAGVQRPADHPPLGREADREHRAILERHGIDHHERAGPLG